MKPSMLSNAERRLQVTAAEPHWRIKFILRIVIMLFDFISIVVTASMPNLYGLVLVMNYIPLGISFFWCLANVVVRARRPRPMHPGANVAMDLLMFALNHPVRPDRQLNFPDGWVSLLLSSSIGGRSISMTRRGTPIIPTTTTAALFAV